MVSEFGFKSKDRSLVGQGIPDLYAYINMCMLKNLSFIFSLLTCGKLVWILIKLSMHGQIDASLSKLQESVESNFKDMDDTMKTLRKRLSDDYVNILYCLDNLGLICTYEV